MSVQNEARDLDEFMNFEEPEVVENVYVIRR